MKLKFPEHFLWGSATSAHQVEGNNKNSDWWRWENSAQRIAQLQKQIKNPEEYKSGIADDSYNRYAEDFDIAKSLNQKAHRLSIEWARVEPQQGEFDQEQIEHYAKVLKALKDRGMKTFVTLHHFTNPLWFADIGGWENKDAPILFLRYAEKVLEQLHADIDFICVINEPNLYAALAYLQAIWPPQKCSFFKTQIVRQNTRAAHRKVYQLCKIKKYNCQVGTANHLDYIVLRGPLKIFKSFFESLFYMRSLRLLAPYCDFIGINYYTSYILKLSWKYPFIVQGSDQTEQTDFGWKIIPHGLGYLLRQLKVFKKPIYITENGIADFKDTQRKNFIRDHILTMHAAIEDGVDLRGYLYWSLLDNFEWAEGYTMKFGLVRIDRENNLKREIRESAKFYAQICKDNSIESI